MAVSGIGFARVAKTYDEFHWGIVTRSDFRHGAGTRETQSR